MSLNLICAVGISVMLAACAFSLYCLFRSLYADAPNQPQRRRHEDH